MDLAAVLRAAPPTAVVYVCGPTALIEAVINAADVMEMAPERVQWESFL